MKTFTLARFKRLGSVEGVSDVRSGNVKSATGITRLAKYWLNDIRDDHYLPALKSRYLQAFRTGYRQGVKQEEKRMSNPGKIQIVVPPGTPVKVLGNPGARISRKKISNIEQGFYAGGKFHPIRASSDYDPSRAGEGGSKRKSSRKKASKRKTSRRAASNAPARKAAAKKRYGVRVGNTLAYVGTSADAAAKAAAKLRAQGRKSVKRAMVKANPITGKLPTVGWRKQFKNPGAVRKTATRRKASNRGTGRTVRAKRRNADNTRYALALDRFGVFGESTGRQIVWVGKTADAARKASASLRKRGYDPTMINVSDRYAYGWRKDYARSRAWK